MTAISEPYQRALALHAEGWPVVRIAGAIGKKQSHVWSFLRKRGLAPIVGRKSWTEEQRIEIVEYSEDHGVKAASEKYGVNQATVYDWRNRLCTDEPPCIYQPAGKWHPESWKLIRTADGKQHLWPRSRQMPDGATMPPRAYLHGVEFLPYMDGRLVARLSGLTVPPALADELSATLAGSHDGAISMLRCEAKARTEEAHLLDAPQRAAALKTRRVLVEFGFYRLAAADIHRAGICDVLIRSVEGLKLCAS